MAIESFEYKELEKMTDNFSEANYIGYCLYGKVYRGKFREKAVTVKIWTENGVYHLYSDQRKGKLDDEILLLEYESLKVHPNLVKIIGSCYEDKSHLGIVYDLCPLDNVRNLLPKDSFDWMKRMKVAVGLALAINAVHTADVQDPVFMRTLDPSNILCDQAYNPMLFEFGMVSGGKFGDRIKPPFKLPGCWGHASPFTCWNGEACPKEDVFAYGVILFSLMTKRTYDYVNDVREFDSLVWHWAKKQYKKLQKKTKKGVLLVEDSLKKGPLFYASDARKLTKLGMKCFNYYPENRPTIGQVLDILLSLRVVKESVSFMGLTDDQIYGDGKLKAKSAISISVTEAQPCNAEKVKVKTAVSTRTPLRRLN